MCFSKKTLKLSKPPNSKTCLLILDSFDSISCFPYPVKNFFQVFSTFLFIVKSWKKNGERGIWTLAPVTRPTPLAGAPLQPLEYFSSPENSLPRYWLFTALTTVFHRCIDYYIKKNLSCQQFFLIFFFKVFLPYIKMPIFFTFIQDYSSIIQFLAV